MCKTKNPNMKLNQSGVIFCLFILGTNLHGQEFGSKDTLNISIVTDANFSTSTDESKKEASAGIGTLGLNFERGYVYGGAKFIV